MLYIKESTPTETGYTRQRYEQTQATRHTAHSGHTDSNNSVPFGSLSLPRCHPARANTAAMAHLQRDSFPRVDERRPWLHQAIRAYRIGPRSTWLFMAGDCQSIRVCKIYKHQGSMMEGGARKETANAHGCHRRRKSQH